MKGQSSENNDEVVKTKQILTVISVLILFVTQIFLYITPIKDQTIFPTPIWIEIYGVIIFMAVLITHPSKRITSLFSKIPFTRPILLLTLSIGFSILAVVGSFLSDKDNRTIYIPITTFWFFSICFYIAAFWKNFGTDFHLPSFIHNHRVEIGIISAIALLASILRFYKLGEIPFVINGDEGVIGVVAQSTNSGPLANPFALWDNFGAFYLQGIYFCIKLFGANTFALRLLPALGGILSVLAVFLLANEISNKRVSVIAAVLVATSHAHINYSRTAAVAYIQETWLIPLELFFFLRGIRKQNSFFTALAGVILAIHYCIYLSANISTALILVFILILAVSNRSWLKSVYRQLLAFGGGFIIIFLPELTYILRNPNEFFNRLNKDGSFQSGWLANTALESGKSAVQIIGDRVSHAFLTLIYYPSIDFYGSRAPILTFITASFFALGLGIILWKVRDKGYLLLNGYFWSCTIAIGMFALPPSADSYRMSLVIPAAAIIAAEGIYQTLKLIGFEWEISRGKFILTAGVILTSIVLINIWIYFFDFAGSCKYGDDTQTRFSTHLGYYLSTLKREAPVYLLSTEDIFYGQNPAVDYLSDQKKIKNVSGAADKIAPISGTVLIAAPGRETDLQAWAKLNPGGNFTYKYDCKRNILSAYEIP